MDSFLFNLIIHPIQQILETCYLIFFDGTRSAGISIISLSFVVTLLCLPLYATAEAWQEKERLLQKKLSGRIKKIKKTFHGDEQFFMLNEYYRQNNYHPLMALRSSFGLLIQIPFFIAAYTFISHIKGLHGVSFLFIKDLAKPDALIPITGNFSLNVLPVAMTIINCISGAVYSYSHDSIREKIQIYLSAAIFLLLLYNSPAGLVLYWTMNNLLSLVKNIYYKMKNPLKALYITMFALAVAGIAAAIFILPDDEIEIRIFLVLVCVAIIISPRILFWLNKILTNHFTNLDTTPPPPRSTLDIPAFRPDSCNAYRACRSLNFDGIRASEFLLC